LNEKAVNDLCATVCRTCSQHTKPQLDSLVGECVATTLGWVYPLGAADESTFDFDDCRLEPTASSQGGSIGMSIVILLPDDR
jgi:hypothetical protein